VVVKNYGFDYPDYPVSVAPSVYLWHPGELLAGERSVRSIGRRDRPIALKNDRAVSLDRQGLRYALCVLGSSLMVACASVTPSPEPSPSNNPGPAAITLGTNWHAPAEQGGFEPLVFLLADSGYSPYATTIETRRELLETKP